MRGVDKVEVRVGRVRRSGRERGPCDAAIVRDPHPNIGDGDDARQAIGPGGHGHGLGRRGVGSGRERGPGRPGQRGRRNGTVGAIARTDAAPCQPGSDDRHDDHDRGKVHHAGALSSPCGQVDRPSTRLLDRPSRNPFDTGTDILRSRRRHDRAAQFRSQVGFQVAVEIDVVHR